MARSGIVVLCRLPNGCCFCPGSEGAPSSKSVTQQGPSLSPALCLRKLVQLSLVALFFMCFKFVFQPFFTVGHSHGR